MKIKKVAQSAGLVATVVDNLTSTSTTDGLSANQGRILANRNNYSTEEQVIGEYLDKTLCRKTIIYTNTNGYDCSTNLTFTHNLGIEDILNYKGMIKREDGTEQPLNLYLPNVNANAEVNTFDFNANDFHMYFGSYYNKETSWQKITSIKITLEYTKLTD